MCTAAHYCLIYFFFFKVTCGCQEDKSNCVVYSDKPVMGLSKVLKISVSQSASPDVCITREHINISLAPQKETNESFFLLP